jgi:hypothetical protein
MTDEEIDLAMKMLMYSAIGSEQEVKNATPIELILQLQYFFPKEVLEEAVKRLITMEEHGEVLRICQC